MAFEVRNHVLCQDGKKVRQVPSPNRGGALKPSLLVMHYTGSPSYEGAIRTLTDGKAANRVSAHLVLSPAGDVAQLLPLNVVGWHAGESSWHGRSGCNSFAIGIEMVNSGLLGHRAKGGYFDRLTGHPVDAHDVMLAKHKNGGGKEAWQIFSPAQIEAATGIAAAIVKAYGIKDVVGHDDIAPHRKIDPGPAWPMVSFVSRVTGRA